MKTKTFLILTIVFFLLVNTMHLLEYLPIHFFIILLSLLLILCYFAFVIGLITLIITIVRERFSNKFRIKATVIIMVLLTSIFLKPTGVINWDRLIGKDIFIAYREGAANCMITFRLKENNIFTLEDVCFGISRARGRYEMINDSTIQLFHKHKNRELSEYTFAAFRTENIRGPENPVFRLGFMLYSNKEKEYLGYFVVDTTYNNFGGGTPVAR